MMQQLDKDEKWKKWLEYFYIEADFGPADDEVRMMMYEDFKEETGIVIEGLGDEA